VIRANDSGWDGGGIHSHGAYVRIQASVIAGNHALNGGGAYESQGDGSMRVFGSIIQRNEARWRGGGLLVGSEHSTLTDTIVRGNSARRGGGVWNEFILTLTRTTVTGNVAQVRGGGIFSLEDLVELDAASSVTGNTPDDCAGTTAC
jgi:hypothetical protein